MDARITALLYSLIAAFATFVGVQLLVVRENFARKYSLYLISFAAGVMLTVAFTHLLPEALEHNPHAIRFMLAGFVTFFLIESMLIIHSCPMHQCEGHGGKPKEITGHIAFMGLMFHSFVDGLIIGVGFEINNTIGMLAALGIIMHKLPEGVSTYSILIAAMPRKKALFRAYLEASSTVIGTVVCILFIRNISESMLGILLGLASGSFTYVAASDLIPQTHEVSGFKSPLCFIGGIAFILLVTLIRHG
jgi:ZIP family zinc transporter/zinc and cadmium transporter